MALFDSFWASLGAIVAGLFLTFTGNAAIGIRLVLAGSLALISDLSAPSGQNGLEDSPRYGLDNTTNEAHEGGTVPVIYGQERIAPKWISKRKSLEGGNEVVWYLGLIGHGVITGITDVQINGNASANYPSVAQDVRPGTATQTAIPGFETSGQLYDASTVMDTGVNFVHTGRQAHDITSFAMIFQRGIYYRNNNGLYASGNSVYIERKKFGEPDSMYAAVTSGVTGWSSALFGGGSAGGWYSVLNITKTSRHNTHLEITHPTSQRWVIRLSGSVSNVETGTVSNIRVPTVETINEIQTTSQTYPGYAILGMKIPQTGQISGSDPRVTCLVQGLEVYNPATDTTEWTRNPVWCLRDYMLNATYGVGHRYVSADIDDGVGGSWRTIASTCDDSIKAPGLPAAEPRCELDLVIDSQAPNDEWASQFLASFRGSIIPSDGLIKLAREEVKASSRDFSTTEGDGNRKNILATQLDDEVGYTSSLVAHTLPTRSRYTRITAKFNNRDNDYNAETFTIENKYMVLTSVVGLIAAGDLVATSDGLYKGYVISYDTTTKILHYMVDPDYEAESSAAVGAILVFSTAFITAVVATAPYGASPAVPLQKQFFGLTRKTHVFREAMFLLLKSELTPERQTFGAFMGDIDIEPADVVTLTDTRLGYASQDVIVTAINFNQQGYAELSSHTYDARIYGDYLAGSGEVTAATEDTAQILGTTVQVPPMYGEDLDSDATAPGTGVKGTISATWGWK